MIRAEKIKKRYGKTEILHNVNFEIKKGKIYGVIGPNGAGKTSIFRILAGLAKETEGNLIFYNNEMEKNAARKKMSFMIENPYLETEMTAFENLKLTGILFGVNEKDKILEILKLVGLENTGKKKVKNFSLGMRQRLGIGIALLKNPDVVVLDEPMNGLDPEGMIEIRKLLYKLNQEFGMTIVISSHLLSELYQLAEEFILVRRGTVIEQITKEDINISEGESLEDYYMKKVGMSND